MTALAMLAGAVHHSRAAAIIATTPLPPSYGGDRFLAALNLWAMLTGTYLAGAEWLTEAASVWRFRRFDRWSHPVTAVRLTMMLCGLAAFVRCAAEAATILGWDRRDPVTGAVILNLKHYLDPVAVGLLFAWLLLRQATKASVDRQLRTDPLPTRMWSTLPQIAKPLLVALLVSVMSFGVVYLRGQ